MISPASTQYKEGSNLDIAHLAPTSEIASPEVRYLCTEPSKLYNSPRKQLSGSFDNPYFKPKIIGTSLQPASLDEVNRIAQNRKPISPFNNYALQFVPP